MLGGHRTRTPAPRMHSQPLVCLPLRVGVPAALDHSHIWGQEPPASSQRLFPPKQEAGELRPWKPTFREAVCPFLTHSV